MRKEQRDDIYEIMMALPPDIDMVGFVRWLQAPQSLMSGKTPLEGLSEGIIDEVIACAAAVGAS